MNDAVEILYANQGDVILNPRHVERLEMKKRIRQGASSAGDPDFRVDAYTPQGCYMLTSWVDEEAATAMFADAGRIITKA